MNKIQIDKKLYIKAKKLVEKEKNSSASYIQRTLGIGYNRAREIVLELEKNAVI